MPSPTRSRPHYPRARVRPAASRPFSARPALSALAADNISGASTIGRKAVEILQQWARAVLSSKKRQRPLLSDGRPARPLPFRGEGSEWRHAAESLAMDIVSCQPAMATPLLLANEVFLSLEAASALPGELTRRSVASAVGRACRRFLRLLSRSVEAIQRSAARLIRTGTRIVTYSASEAVEEVFRRARSRGRRFAVTLSEGRPAEEGTALARRLARGGIDVTLLSDAALFGGLDGADMVLVGADAVCREGVINKCGTAALAELAAARRIPLVVVAGCEKFLPPPLAPFLSDRQRPARELHARRAAGLRVVNTIFDLTPAGCVHRYATGWGPLAPEEVAALLSGLRSSGRLQRALVSRLGRPSAPGRKGRRAMPGRRRRKRRSAGGRSAARRGRI